MVSLKKIVLSLLMLVPLALQATDYVSTVTGVDGNGETAACTLVTSEGNNWTLGDGVTASYVSGAGYAEVNTSSAENGVFFYSSFQVSGVVTSVTLQVASLNGGAFYLRTAGADGGDIVSRASVGASQAITSYTFKPTTSDNAVLSESTLTMQFLPNGSTDGAAALYVQSITITTLTPYGLTVKGSQVTALNKDNILGDAGKSVRFDPATNTLSLYSANVECAASENFVESMLPSLTVMLNGTNVVTGGTNVFNSNLETSLPTLTFASSGSKQDKLKWTSTTLQSGFSSTITYNNGLTFDEANHLIAVTPKDYGLTVAGTPVTDVNSDDVMGDGKVKYDAETSTLTLNGVNLTGEISVDTISALTVMLQNGNTINTSGACFTSAKTATLVFDMNPNNQGHLVLKGKSSAAAIQSGFTFTADRENAAYLKNGLEQGQLDSDWMISTFVPIEPIVDEEKTEASVTVSSEQFQTTEGGETKNVDLSNTEIDNVLYTLPTTLSDTSTNQGYDEAKDSTPGVLISTALTDAEVNAAITNKVGSSDYANSFFGITLMTPAGIGELKFSAKSLGGKIRVKVGDEAAYTPEAVTDGSYNDVSIPFNCSEPTCVRIYLLDEAPSSRSSGALRGKVQTGMVKVKGYSASSSVMVSSGGASVYSGGSSYYNSATASVTMSSVTVGGPSSRGTGARAKAPASYTIVELGPDVFSDLSAEQKAALRYIDLSGTAVKNLTVNRGGGVLNGVGDYTLVYLPSGNDDGDESNVVIGGSCRRLVLNDDYPFRAPVKSFTAASAQLERTFNVGTTSTVFLPFAIPESQATSLGNFHTFNRIEGGNAVFNNAVSGEIAANTPYIFVPKATTLAASGVTVPGLDDTKAVSGNLEGTYERIDWVESNIEGIYAFAGAAQGTVAAGDFVRIGAGAWTPPFRAYLRVPAASSRLHVVVGSGEQDDIATVVSDSRRAAQWYSLDGRRLNGRPSVSGLYINNGKKIFVR